jgi:growth factor-regulated tyrosine kinase substrate
MQPRSARVDDGFDDDLKRALAMSLEEVNGHAGAGHVSQTKNQASSKPKEQEYGSSRSSGNKKAEEEDDDLKAAIAASLADMEEQKKKHAATIKEQSSSSAKGSAGAFVMPKNDYELTPVEAENINLFSTLVDRLQTQPPGTILREPQIQELYDSIGALRPKLARTYGETMSKHGKYSALLQNVLAKKQDALLDLHAKLSTVVRYYDRMLEDRLSNTYNQHTIGGYNLPPPQRATSNMYPSIPNLANTAGGAESFYIGNAQAEPFGRPQSMYSAQPHQQYSSFEKRALIASTGYAGPAQRPEFNQFPPQGQAPPPQSSWQANDPSSTPTPGNPGYSTQDSQQDTYNQYPPQSNPSQPQKTPIFPAANTVASSYPTQAPNYAPEMPQQAPPPGNASSHSVLTPSTDPNSAFYFNNTSQAPQEPSQNQSQFLATQSPQQYHSLPLQQVPPQQYSNQPSKQQTAASFPLAHQTQQAPGQTYNGYTQESFPSAPHHAPQQNMMEESLIDL